MTAEQYNRAKEIEAELADIQYKWRFANDQNTTITNKDGSPCDREKFLESFRQELQAQADSLKKEFIEL